MEIDTTIRKRSILVRKRKFGLSAKSTASFDCLKLEIITGKTNDHVVAESAGYWRPIHFGQENQKDQL
jgi:hypothetical protein